MNICRLFILDDEPKIARALQQIAEGCGYEVTCTTRADDFKAAYARSAPDVIILDLAIPDMDGIEMLRWLAAEGCTATIMIVSGFEGGIPRTAKTFGDALGLKMAEIMRKPFRVAEIRERLTDLATALNPC